MIEREVAEALLEIGAVGFAPHAPITFKSGIVSPVYVDNRTLPYYPAQWHRVIEGFRGLIERESLEFDIIGGIAVGGVPHSAALSYILNRPSIFIRQVTKDHGKGRMVEGGEVEGKRVLLVEDLVTTGDSSLHGVNALRDAGALVNDVIAIVSYGFAEAKEAFGRAGVQLHTLTRFDVITQAAMEMGHFGPEEKTLVDDWLRDPRGWATRRGIA
jgi:orotate phosphoribosyltransferase